MSEIKVLTIKEDILAANEEKARANRERLDRKGILLVNIMSSPGAGKTTLILQTIRSIKDRIRIGIIEGDVASTLDAERVSREGVPVVQINTAGGCHLDANMISCALDNLPLENLDLIFVENVGNLICPAEFALGEHKKVMLLSVPEGDDKPHKYPLMFTEVDLVLVNKIDVLPFFDFDLNALSKVLSSLNPSAKLFSISAKNGEGLDRWFSWLESQIEEKKSHERT